MERDLPYPVGGKAERQSVLLPCCDIGDSSDRVMLSLIMTKNAIGRGEAFECCGDRLLPGGVCPPPPTLLA